MPAAIAITNEVGVRVEAAVVVIIVVVGLALDARFVRKVGVTADVEGEGIGHRAVKVCLANVQCIRAHEIYAQTHPVGE